ncbi:COG1361 S-layer family protein [Halorubrum amylolyticum]|uniref:COG1361 S-layer family protein n=1 Tax=Halorubrum amylolyticum TaxID=2508724 RepID=UPI001008B352|nr:COG1361 S-layer family protein [Halorubrum amylolyticum]
MSRRSLALLAAVALLAGAFAGLAVAQEEPPFVRGEPELDVFLPDSTVSPGTTADLTVQIANDGDVDAGSGLRRDTVTTARSVVVDVRNDGSPLVVETDRFAVGSIGDGAVREVPVSVRVPADAEPGTYSLDVRLEYSYTHLSAPRSGVVQDRTRTRTESVSVTVDDGPRFAMRTVDTDVQVGDAGTLTANVTNVGGEVARDLSVELVANGPDLALGETERNTAQIDRLDPGENATVRFPASVSPDAAAESFDLTGTVRYTDVDGIRGAQEGIPVGVRPLAEQSFSVEVDDATLRVGENGSVSGTIRNDGPTDVRGVVLAVGDGAFAPRSPRYAVGDLAVGETAAFRFRGEVPASADSVPQQLTLATSYRSVADTERTTRESVRVPVAERRDAVTVEPVDPQFAAGGDGVLRLDVTNRRDVELRDIELRLAADAPLESEFRTTVIPSLAPGETGRVAFDLSVDGDAPASRYPASVDVAYTDPTGVRVTGDTATVAVAVVESSGGAIPIEAGVLIVLLLLVAAGAWWFYVR